MIIGRAVSQVFKPVLDCAVLHRADPQAFERLVTASFLVNKPKNELTFTPCICGADQLVNILSRHQPFKNVELPLLVRKCEPKPLIRNDREVFGVPFTETAIVVVRLSKSNQMADAPRNDVSTALQITVLSLICPDHFCDGLGDAGFFRYYKFHELLLPPTCVSRP